jgi:putative peptidoglycan lipid II flippase
VAIRRTITLRLNAWLVREYSIPEASVLFMVAFLISASLGVLRQVLFNAQFGAGPEASAFYAAFRLPDTLTSLIAGGTLSNALIPVLARVSREEGRDAEWRLINLVLNSFTGFFALVILASLIFAPVFVERLLAPGFDPTTRDLTVSLTRIMLLHALLGVVSSVGMALLNSRAQFTLTGLSIICHNFTLISGILAARSIPGVGVYGPALGVVGDALLQLLILIPGIRANQFRYRPIWSLRDRRLREVVRMLLPNGLSAGVNYAGTIVDTAYASLAREAAALPALQNAVLLIGVPIRLLGIAVGQAAFPRLAAHAAAADRRQIRATIVRALAITVALALPVMLGLIGVGRELIRALFERGRFDAGAGSLTYAMLAAYALALPAYIGTELVSRGLIAMHDTTTPLITNCGQLLSRVALIVMLLDTLGALAIPIAFAISSALETAALAGVLFWRLRGSHIRDRRRNVE